LWQITAEEPKVLASSWHELALTRAGHQILCGLAGRKIPLWTFPPQAMRVIHPHDVQVGPRKGLAKLGRGRRLSGESMTLRQRYPPGQFNLFGLEATNDGETDGPEMACLAVYILGYLSACHLPPVPPADRLHLQSSEHHPKCASSPSSPPSSWYATTSTYPPLTKLTTSQAIYAEAVAAQCRGNPSQMWRCLRRDNSNSGYTRSCCPGGGFMENGAVCRHIVHQARISQTNKLSVLHGQLARFPELLHRSLGQRLLGRQRLRLSEATTGLTSTLGLAAFPTWPSHIHSTGCSQILYAVHTTESRI
jgi:hypothetical protein